MSRDIERRIEKLEAGRGASGGEMVRVFIPPPDCPDPEAWEQACYREAEAAGAQKCLVVRFVKPNDVRRHGEPLQ